MLELNQRFKKKIQAINTARITLNGNKNRVTLPESVNISENCQTRAVYEQGVQQHEEWNRTLLNEQTTKELCEMTNGNARSDCGIVLNNLVVCRFDLN